jgi:hypothetical protein
MGAEPLRMSGPMGHPPGVQIPEADHLQLFHRALEDADVDEATTALFRIAAAVHDGEAEVAYLAPPSPGRINYAAMQAVGSDVLHDYDGLHRFLAYVEIPDAPLSAIATELRHEAQHARQFNLYGPHFVDLDRILRDLVRTGGAAAYEQLPSERDANAAARAFALEQYADDLARMTGDARFRQYTVEVDAADDLVGETLALIWENASRDQVDDPTGRPLGDVVDELAGDVSDWHQRVADSGVVKVLRTAAQQPLVNVVG